MEKRERLRPYSATRKKNRSWFTSAPNSSGSSLKTSLQEPRNHGRHGSSKDRDCNNKDQPELVILV